MDKFYLEKPTLIRKMGVVNYINEFKGYSSNIPGTGPFYRLLDGISYEECLEEMEKLKNEEYALSANKCTAETFLFIRKNDDRIVGMINVRYSICDDLLSRGATHIGYSIRPTERKKGYNKIQLYLGLLEEQKLGEKRIIIGCDMDNVHSNKSIIALGGELFRTELDPYDNTYGNDYYIDVDKSIIKYKEVYEKYIS